MRLDEFLLARIAEDEAVARESDNRDSEPETTEEWEADARRGERYDVQPHGRKCGWRLGEGLETECTCGYPARVLAECKAKRRQIGVLTSPFSPRSRKFWSWRDRILAIMAQPYADHPDFDPSWRL